MEYILIGLITFLGAGLTLFSGFGLGTLLMPVFGIFFPIEIAIALTAIVHFSNNLIKLGFYYQHIDWKIIVRFGIPSVIAAFVGAYFLNTLANSSPILTYTLYEKFMIITPMKLTIALLLLIFSLIELIPKLSGMQFDKKYMPLGGLLSGFFGGLSGNQGALRSSFLIRAGLSKELFIGTGVVIACLVDITRLSLYASTTLKSIDSTKMTLLSFAVLCAFLGVYIGNKVVKKITIKTLQTIVAILLLVFSVLLGLGII